MTRLGTLGGWSGAAGTVILSALTHTMPVLLYAVAAEIALCICFLGWILCDDRRVERMNVLLRGGTLASQVASAAELDRGKPAEHVPAQPVADSPIDPQARAYIALLRKTGRAELADELERALGSDTEQGSGIRSRSEGGVT